MKNIICILVLCFLAGCSCVPKVQEVLIPVQVPCKVEPIKKPSFSFNDLQIGEDIFQQVKVLLADRKLFLGYTKELEVAVDSCK